MRDARNDTEPLILTTRRSYLTWSVHDQPNSSLTGIFVSPERQQQREKLPRAAAGFLSLGAQVCTN